MRPSQRTHSQDFAACANVDLRHGTVFARCRARAQGASCGAARRRTGTTVCTERALDEDPPVLTCFKRHVRSLRQASRKEIHKLGGFFQEEKTCVGSQCRAPNSIQQPCFAVFFLGSQPSLHHGLCKGYEGTVPAMRDESLAQPAT